MISVVVTAQDGETTQNVYSDGDAGRVGGRGSECALAEWSDAVACLRVGDDDVYSVGGEHAVTESTVTATLAVAGAAYEVKLNGVVDQDGIVPLAVGDGNVIAVVVTAEDRRDDAEVHGDCHESRVGGRESECAVAEWGDAVACFHVGDDERTRRSVGHAVAETTVTATASDANASVEVTPGDADDGTSGNQVALVVGETTISVEVTAEDGKTTTTYTVTVTRAELFGCDV